MRLCMYVYVLCVCVCMRMYVGVYVYTHMRVCVCMCMRMWMRGWGRKIKKNLKAAFPEKFATFWYQIRENRSINVEVVCGHTDRQTT